jgi:hypothetical protein
MFILCLKRCLYAPSSHPVCHQTIQTYASTKMALALLFVKVCDETCVCQYEQKCNNNPLSEQEGKDDDGCMNKENGVSGNHSFIIFTLLKLAKVGILIPYALMQYKVTMISISLKLSLYTYFLPTCQTIWHK